MVDVSKEIEGNAKFGVLSDTHVPTRADSIPQQLLNRLKDEDVDQVLHAGDIVSRDVLDVLEEIAPLTAVYGNMDPMNLKRELPRLAVLEVNDLKIGLCHRPIDVNEMKEKDLDVLIHGHTHVSSDEEINGKRIINPGSATNSRMGSESFMIIEVGKNMETNLINIKG